MPADLPQSSAPVPRGALPPERGHLTRGFLEWVVMLHSIVAAARRLPRGGIGLSVALLGVGWYFLGETALTDRQLSVLGVATVGLAAIADGIIGVAIAPPPHVDDVEDDDDE